MASIRNARKEIDYGEQSSEDESEESSVEESGSLSEFEDDENDSHCFNCGKATPTLLCCELCPRVYHRKCLSPPLAAIPKGDWFCPRCVPVRMLQLEVERIIDERSRPSRAGEREGDDWDGLEVKPAGGLLGANTARAATPVGDLDLLAAFALEDDDDPDAMGQAAEGEARGEVSSSGDARSDSFHSALSEEAEAAAAVLAPAAKRAAEHGRRTGTGAAGSWRVKELYVKWRGRAYTHCAWVPEAAVVAAARKAPQLLRRLKVFRQHQDDSEADVDEREAAAEEDADCVPHTSVPLAWTRVDRIIARRLRGKAAELEYLIKWQELGHNEATWESAASLTSDAALEAVAAFGRRRPIVDELAERRPAAPAGKRGRHGRGAPGAGTGPKREKRFAKTPPFLAGGQLHGYQLEGVNWLCHAWDRSEHVILADEMGLGKTIQTIALLAALHAEGVAKPHLIVVPLSTAPNWQREFQAWAPQLNVVAFSGNRAARDVIRRHELYAEREPSHGKRGPQDRVQVHALIVSYEMAMAEFTELRRLEWGVMVVDEGHRLKDPKSRLFKALTDLRTQLRVLLTGTPLQNSLAELFMLLSFLDKSKFDSLEEFEQEFTDISQEEQVKKLHETLKSHLLRRVKRDVLCDLPRKAERVVRVELSRLQKDWYRGILTASLPDLVGSGRKAPGMRNVLMQLRKCCNHAFLLDGVEAEHALQCERDASSAGREVPSLVERLLEASGKLELLDKMLARLLPAGHRVLIYSQFTTMLDILEDYLRERRLGFQRIDGNVAGSERQARIDAFNTSPTEYGVFLLSTRAGGLGINLASADTVVIFDSDWNPHNDLQAQARAHRLGQLKTVMIYRLVTHNTVEERMLAVSRRKLVLERVVVQTAADASLRQRELDDLLRHGAAELFAEEKEDAAGAPGASVSLGVNRERSRMDTAGMEKAAGRMGAAGKRVVYDDAAIKRLLDRSELEGDAPPEDTFGNDLMAAFKVAAFEFAEPGASPTAALPDGPAAGIQDGGRFWKGLLEEGFSALELAKQAEEGKGRRRRKQVNYADPAAAELEELGSDSDAGGSGPASDASLPAASGVPLRVCGLDEAGRRKVILLLARYGVMQQQPGKLFAHLYGAMTPIPPTSIELYGVMVMNVVTNSPSVPALAAAGLTGDVILPPGSDLQMLARRLGEINVVRQRVAEMSQMSATQITDFLRGPGFPVVQGWAAWQDQAVLMGTATYGWGQYDEMLADPKWGLLLAGPLEAVMALGAAADGSQGAAAGAAAGGAGAGGGAVAQGTMGAKLWWLDQRLQALLAWFTTQAPPAAAPPALAAAGGDSKAADNQAEPDEPAAAADAGGMGVGTVVLQWLRQPLLSPLAMRNAR
ncbi:hypothetical protein WJX81_006723 [Elliptochloris bilobata]|uniref:CHD3-type chromatin-remodeling factor PICKLE n=1 Tax=Elliptochloris bilobata TaxID=381761 RepID=A0AAW1R1N6_9CHLO